MSTMKFVFGGHEVKYKYCQFYSSNGTILTLAMDPFPDQPLFHLYHSLDFDLQWQILKYLCHWNVHMELMELFTDKVLEVVLPNPYITVRQLKEIILSGTGKTIDMVSIGSNGKRWNDSRSVIEYRDQNYCIPRFYYHILTIFPFQKRLRS